MRDAFLKLFLNPGRMIIVSPARQTECFRCLIIDDYR